MAGVRVFIGNDPAQCAYEKHEFAAVAQKLDPEFESAYLTPGTRTLRRAL